MMVQGTVAVIEEVWKDGFKFNRSRKFVPSCKTISGIEKLCPSESHGINDTEELFKFPEKLELPDDLLDECKKIKNPKIPSDVVFVYGVVMPKDNDWNTPTVYGVTGPTSIN